MKITLEITLTEDIDISKAFTVSVSDNQGGVRAVCVTQDLPIRKEILTASAQVSAE